MISVQRGKGPYLDASSDCYYLHHLVAEKGTMKPGTARIEKWCGIASARAKTSNKNYSSLYYYLSVGGI